MSLRLVLALALFLTSLSGATGPRERKLYVGSDSTEAILRFEGKVRIKKATRPTESEIETYLEEQANHLFGPMGEAAIKAVPKGDHKFTSVSTPKKTEERNIWEVTYKYKSTAVVHNDAGDTYEVIVPINPATIYKEAEVNGKQPCTDHHYDSEGDFWYFWTPDKEGCQLTEGVNYFKFAATLERFENTKITYPEYNRLIRKYGDVDGIHMTILFGMDNESKGKDPLRSADINAENFRDLRTALLGMGFESNGKWSGDDIQSYFNAEIDTNVYVEELTKKNRKATLVIRLFFGPSGIDESSQTFHYFYKDALEKSSVMMYDGHSGLGAHLDLESIQDTNDFKIRFPSEKYQILYFNSCTSYTYYNTQYFKRKGPKHMDILTNGLATFFSVMQETNMALIKAIDLWTKGRGAVSYQALAKTIDSGNLFGVNGDEDNPTTPPR